MSEGNSGCWKVGAIGCGVLLLAVGIGGYYAYIAAAQAARDVGAAGLEAMTEEMMKELKLPPEEVEAAMQPVHEFADRIRNGEVGLEEIGRVGEALDKGNLIAIFMMRGFQLKYLEPSGLPDEEKQAGAITVSRFVQGLTTEAIAQEEWEAVSDVICTTTTDESGNTNQELKDALTDEELRHCLTLAREAADEAAIPQQKFAIDLAAELQKALDQGRKTPAPDSAGGSH